MMMMKMTDDLEGEEVLELPLELLDGCPTLDLHVDNGWGAQSPPSNSCAEWMMGPCWSTG